MRPRPACPLASADPGGAVRKISEIRVLRVLDVERHVVSEVRGGRGADRSEGGGGGGLRVEAERAVGGDHRVGGVEHPPAAEDEPDHVADHRRDAVDPLQRLEEVQAGDAPRALGEGGPIRPQRFARGVEAGNLVRLIAAGGEHQQGDALGARVGAPLAGQRQAALPDAPIPQGWFVPALPIDRAGPE